jgi:hypothetical protein
MFKGNYVINLKKFLGETNSFEPNYQFECPFEFGALVKHYMKYYYDADKEPEKYLDKLGHAVRYANKSILLDKLGLSALHEIEDSAPVFKSTMAELAKSDSNLLVDGDSIEFQPVFLKSMNGSTPELNRLYESIYKQTCDTLATGSRI